MCWKMDTTEPDLFTDFLMLTVPKQAPERSTWKYDVQDDFKMLTVYRLQYNNHIAKITDCICLQFCYDLSSPLGYSFIPTYSSSGEEMDASSLAQIIGRNVVTSPLDVRTLLNYLDGNYGEKYHTKENVKDYEESAPLMFDEDFDDVDHDNDYEPEKYSEHSEGSTGEVVEAKEPKKKRNRSKQSRENKTESDTPMKKKRKWYKRRTPKEIALDVVQSSALGRPKKRSKIGRPSKKETDTWKSIESAVQSLNDLLNDCPLLPVHPTSGGTIYSSEYWKSSSESREKLKCSMDIFVEADVLHSLPNVQETSAEENYEESVKYGWRLLEHLLGGNEAMSRTFAYCSSDSSPISQHEVLHLIEEMCDGIIEHMSHSFALDQLKKLREDLMRMVQWRMDPKNFSDKSSKRKRSDIFLRSQLTKHSYPKSRKIQLAFGFDFYLDRTKLAELEDRYREEYEPDEEETDEQRWCRFGCDVIMELIGGLDVYEDDLRKVPRGLVDVVGQDILEAVYGRTRKTFELDDSFTLEEFRKGVAECHKGSQENKKSVEVKTKAMASILFPTTSTVPTAVPTSSTDEPAEPGCSYWSTPAPHRTRLSLDYSIYVDSVRLAEYQRYLGPESARKNKDWNLYAWALVRHILGGEEELLKKLLQARNAGLPLRRVLDSSLGDLLSGKEPIRHHHRDEDSEKCCAVIEHVEKLYNLPAIINKKRVRDCVFAFLARELDAYDKGKARWYFPEFDERKKPEALIKLEAQEYWRKPASDRTQLRPGHDVYIRTKILDSIAAYYGPQSKENDIQWFSYAIVVHMLGGFETAFAFWESDAFSWGFGTMVVLDDLIAVCLYADSVFHLVVSLHPAAFLRFASSHMHRRVANKQKHDRRMANGGKPRSERNILSLALNVP